MAKKNAIKKLRRLTCKHTNRELIGMKQRAKTYLVDTSKERMFLCLDCDLKFNEPMAIDFTYCEVQKRTHNEIDLRIFADNFRRPYCELCGKSIKDWI